MGIEYFTWLSFPHCLLSPLKYSLFAVFLNSVNDRVYSVDQAPVLEVVIDSIFSYLPPTKLSANQVDSAFKIYPELCAFPAIQTFLQETLVS